MNKEKKFIWDLSFANFTPWSVGPISIRSIASQFNMAEIWRKGVHFMAGTQKQRKRKRLGSCHSIQEHAPND